MKKKKDLLTRVEYETEAESEAEQKKNLITFEFVTCFQQFHFIFVNFIMMILSIQGRG